MYVFIIYFGLVTGSFLNVIISRLHSGESIVRGRSHCPNCNKILKWYELVPVFSFIIQGGKCRGCKKPISYQYPLVEISTTLIFLLIFNFQFSRLHQGYGGQAIFNFQSIVELLFLWFVASGLIVIFVYDLKHYIIPDKVLVPLIIVTLASLLFGIWNFGNMFNALVIGTLAATPFAFLHFVSRGGWMGFGDAKLAFFMGLFLGGQKTIIAMFIAFTIGAIIGIGLMVAGKKTPKSQVPFGPFLILGTFAALFWGQELINWYFNLLLK